MGFSCATVSILDWAWNALVWAAGGVLAPADHRHRMVQIRVGEDTAAIRTALRRIWGGRTVAVGLDAVANGLVRRVRAGEILPLHSVAQVQTSYVPMRRHVRAHAHAGSFTLLSMPAGPLS